MRIRSPFLIKAISWGITLLMRLLYRTCRLTLIEKEGGLHPYQETGDQRFLYCAWHDQALMAIFVKRPVNSAALTSRHADGSYIANLLNNAGVKPVRGSTKRGGALAMRQMIEQAKGKHVVITPDGPRGPRRKLKLGILFLASQSENAIIPTAFACTRCWHPQGKWTDMMIPKPFAKITCIAGSPIAIPKELSDAEQKQFMETLLLQMEILELEAEAHIQGLPIPKMSKATNDINQSKAA